MTRGKKKVLPHPKPMSQLVLADPRWISGSHCKPQAYSVGGRGGAGNGRWAPTWGVLVVVVLVP